MINKQFVRRISLIAQLQISHRTHYRRASFNSVKFSLSHVRLVKQFFATTALNSRADRSKQTFYSNTQRNKWSSWPAIGMQQTNEQCRKRKWLHCRFQITNNKHSPCKFANENPLFRATATKISLFIQMSKLVLFLLLLQYTKISRRQHKFYYFAQNIFCLALPYLSYYCAPKLLCSATEMYFL